MGTAGLGYLALGQPFLSVTAATYCQDCHDYVDVDTYCWDCHVDPVRVANE